MCYLIENSTPDSHVKSRRRGDIRIPHSRMTKTCWENIGNLFVICMRQITKGYLYHLGVLDYYVMYRQVTNWVTDPFRWLCELL